MTMYLNLRRLGALALYPAALGTIASSLFMTITTPLLRADTCARVGSACDINRKCHASIFDTDNDPGCTCDSNNICANT
jgi:hypothetical protein